MRKQLEADGKALRIASVAHAELQKQCEAARAEKQQVASMMASFKEQAASAEAEMRAARERERKQEEAMRLQLVADLDARLARSATL